MTAVDLGDLHNVGLKPEPKRDSKGRYRVTDPKGDLRSYTRATTVCKTYEDTYRLERWAKRQVAYGIGLREDLHALTVGHDPDNDRGIYEKIIDEATSAAKAGAAANTGTALHRFTEQLDLGQKTIDQFPATWQPHLEVYRKGMADAGFELEPTTVEAVIALDDYKVAGKLDRTVRLTQDIEIPFELSGTVKLPAGAHLIGDLKTGRNMHWSWLSIGIQLGIYANHNATWEVDLDHSAGGTRGPRIDVNRDVAVLFHLPALKDSPTFDLYFIDLQAGWDAFLCAMEARGHRSTKNKLAIPWRSRGSIQDASAQWVRDRISELSGNGPAVQDLLLRWPESIPKPFPRTDPTAEQIATMAKVLDIVEGIHQIPFGPPDPAAKPKKKGKK